MKRFTLALMALLTASPLLADDSIWVYKKPFSETYHLDRQCPVIIDKKVKAYSLSDESDARTRMRKAIELADNCPICKTPDFRRTRDNRFDEVLMAALGGSFFEDEDTVSADVIDKNGFFDNEIIAGLPEGGKVTSSIYRSIGHRFKMLEVKRAGDERLVGCPITCEVRESRKSNMLGTEGRLVIRPLYITADDGTIVRLKHDDILVRGKNRSNVKLLTFYTFFTWFIPGGGAKIKPEDEFPITLDL